MTEDITNGREHFKIPAFSYKRSDKAPNDYHYVSEHIQYQSLTIDLSLANMFSCECLGDCSDGSCYCSSTQRFGCYYDSKGRLNADYNIEAPEMIFECNVGCKCNKKTCKNMVIQNGCRLQLALFKTKSRGWGVKTLENLKRGTFIGVYSGELISATDSYKRLDDTYLFNLANTHAAPNTTQEQAADQFVCDAKFYGNFTRFINHSCEPNVIGVRTFTTHQDHRFPYISFFTNRDLAANTELTLNYGDNYWLVKCKRDKVFCLCKRSRCRFSKKTFSQAK